MKFETLSSFKLFTDNTEQQNRQDRNNTQTAALIRTPTDEDNVTVIIQTALPTDKETRLYPNLQAINGDTQNAALTDAGSTESGFHEERDENISTSEPLLHELCSHTEIDSKCEGCQNKRNTLNIDQHDNDDCSYKTMKEQPFQDFATGNHFNDYFCFSSSLSPVVTETEPHTGSSFPKTRTSFTLNIPGMFLIPEFSHYILIKDQNNLYIPGYPLCHTERLSIRVAIFCMFFLYIFVNLICNQL